MYRQSCLPQLWSELLATQRKCWSPQKKREQSNLAWLTWRILPGLRHALLITPEKLSSSHLAN